MSGHENAQKVRVKLESRSCGLVVTSDDVPGLFLWGKDPERVFADIKPVIQMLFRENENRDVEVVEERLPSWSPAGEMVPTTFVIHDNTQGEYQALA